MKQSTLRTPTYIQENTQLEHEIRHCRGDKQRAGTLCVNTVKKCHEIRHFTVISSPRVRYGPRHTKKLVIFTEIQVIDKQHARTLCVKKMVNYDHI